jgi:putative membrane-bound dehydrogenase-like protein
MKTLLSLALIAACAGHVHARRLEVLFLGDNGHHKPAERVPQIMQALGPRGINITYTADANCLHNGTLARFDALLIYANIGQITKEQEQGLLEYVHDGGAFLPIHCASYCFLNSIQYVKLVGAQFKSHGTGTFTAKAEKPSHSIMKGFAGFETWDETYVHHKGTADREILQTRQGEPWTWTREPGKGRVFYTAYGHDARTWGNPGFHELVYRGLLWAINDTTRSAFLKTVLPKLVRRDGDLVPNYERRPEAIKVHKPLSPEDSLSHTQVANGLDISLFASEKLGLYSVIEIDWDERGRAWVIETRDYPNEIKPVEEGQDRIRILEDTDSDGRADKAITFADKLSIPTGMCFARGGIIVSMAPDFIFLKDTDGDDKADLRETLFSGWSTGDTHAGPSNLTYGFDNWIWGVMGYAGFNGKVGGEDIRFGQGVYRFKPDGSKLEYLGGTSNNTWGLGFSENNDVFISTANNQSSVYMPIARTHYDRFQGLDQPGRLPGIDANKKFFPITPNVRQVDVFGGFTAAAGHHLYTARSFPQDWWNRAALVNAPTGNLLYRANLKPEGSHFIAENGWNIVASADEWFSPIYSEVGPDGAIWMSDWYSFLIQHNPTPNKGRGGFDAKRGRGNAFESPLRDYSRTRIYRITAKGGMPSKQFNLSKSDPGKLLAAIQSDNMLWRMHAQRLIVETGDALTFTKPLKALIAESKPDKVGVAGAAIHSLWALHGLGAVDATALEAGLAHLSPGARRAAAAVAPRDASFAPAILKTARLDSDPQVRKDALLALSEMPADEAIGRGLYDMRKDPKITGDRWLPTAFQMAAARHGTGYLRAALAESKAAAATGATKPVEIPKDNLIQNPGFEAVDGILPKQWHIRNYGGKATHQVVQPGRGGKGYALMIESEGGANTSMHFDLKVKKRTSYQLSAWLKTEAATGPGAQLNIHALPGQPRTPAVKGDSDWKKVSVRFKTDNRGTISINCLFGGWGSAKGKGYYDDLQLIQLDAGQGADIGEDTGSIVAANLTAHATPTQLSGILNDITIRPTELGNRIKTAIGRPKVTMEKATDDPAELAKTHQVLKISAAEGLKFNTSTLEAKAGRAIAIIVANPDLLQHNFVLGKQGSMQRLGNAADKLITAPNAIEIEYVPQSEDVLSATGLLDPGVTTILKIGPLSAGTYPYLCTFPGHWRIMQGVLTVR